MWTVVDFGKWKGKRKTLPQIITSDPDWLFWCIENDKFVGSLASEAKMLARRARSIRLPAAKAATHCVAYVVTHDGKFGGEAFTRKRVEVFFDDTDNFENP